MFASCFRGAGEAPAGHAPVVWAAQGSAKLLAEAHDLITEPGTELVLSAALHWEIATKSGLRCSDFQVNLQLLHRSLLDDGYAELPVTGAHAVKLSVLPQQIGHPFDRILIAQARVERILLLTADRTLAYHPGPILAQQESAA